MKRSITAMNFPKGCERLLRLFSARAMAVTMVRRLLTVNGLTPGQWADAIPWRHLGSPAGNLISAPQT